MNKFIDNINKKEGSITIIVVILLFVGIIVLAGFLDYTEKKFTLEETQSILDISGASALQSGINQTALKHEEFIIDTDLVESKFKSLVNSSISKYSEIKNHSFERVEVWNDGDTSYGTGESGKTHPQAFIDATIIITVDSNSYFDITEYTSKMFYDARSEENFTVSYHGTTSDGKVELMIRSVTRIVMR